MSVPSPSGYLGAPLAKKLGLKDRQRAVFLNLPGSLRWLVDEAQFSLVLEVTNETEIAADCDVVHAFYSKAGLLEEALPLLMSAIAPNGMIWISWPKSASKRPTDITEDVIRSIALPLGLVDVKVCAVDEVWSGLKLVIRKELRPGK
jgi:hypothetical protein